MSKDDGGLGGALQKVFDFLSKLCAFVLVVTYVVFAINSNWEFITNETAIMVIQYIMYYGPLGIAALVAVEFAVTRNLIVQIFVYVLVAAMIIFQFFPGTWQSIIAAAGGGA